MSIWQRIGQGIAALYSEKLVTNVSALLQAVLTLRYLSTPEYGRLTLLLSFFSTAIVFFDVGLRAIFISEMASAVGNSQLGRLKGLLNQYGRFVTLTTGASALLFGGIGVLQQDGTWLILAAYLLLYGGRNASQALLHAHARYGQMARQSILLSVSRLILLLTLPLWNRTGVGVTAVLLTYPLMEGITLLGSVRWLRPIWRASQGAAAEPVSFRELLQQQGIYTMLANPVRRAIEELPVWTLQLLAGETAVGLFGVARKGVNLLVGLFSPIETIFLPLISEQATVEPERVRIAIRQSQKYLFWLSVGLVLVMLPLAPLFIRLLAGESYEGVIRPFQWLLPILLISALIQSHRPILFAKRAQNWLLFLRVAKLLTIAPLLWLLITLNGVVGAVQAMILDNIIHLFVRWWVLWRVAPELWVSPLTVFRIESFDRQLWTQFRQRLLSLRGSG